MALSRWVRHVVVIMVVAGACGGELTAPIPLAGSYKLSLFNGSALPVTLSRLVSIPANGGAGFSCDNRLVGATLSIESTGLATTADTVRVVCDDGRPDVVTAYPNRGTVTMVSDTARIAYPAAGNATSYRTFTRRNGTGVLIFRTEIDQPVVGSTGSPPSTTLAFDLRQRVYVP